jgi:hypothetical protein
MEREAKVPGRIGRHTNIMSLYDFEISADGSVQFIVFEYLAAGPWRGIWPRVGTCHRTYCCGLVGIWAESCRIFTTAGSFIAMSRRKMSGLMNGSLPIRPELYQIPAQIGPVL